MKCALNCNALLKNREEMLNHLKHNCKKKSVFSSKFDLCEINPSTLIHAVNKITHCKECFESVKSNSNDPTLKNKNFTKKIKEKNKQKFEEKISTQNEQDNTLIFTDSIIKPHDDNNFNSFNSSFKNMNINASIIDVKNKPNKPLEKINEESLNTNSNSKNLNSISNENINNDNANYLNKETSKISDLNPKEKVKKALVETEDSNEFSDDISKIFDKKISLKKNKIEKNDEDFDNEKDKDSDDTIDNKRNIKACLDNTMINDNIFDDKNKEIARMKNKKSEKINLSKFEVSSDESLYSEDHKVNNKKEIIAKKDNDLFKSKNKKKNKNKNITQKDSLAEMGNSFDNENSNITCKKTNQSSKLIEDSMIDSPPKKDKIKSKNNYYSTNNFNPNSNKFTRNNLDTTMIDNEKDCNLYSNYNYTFNDYNNNNFNKAMIEQNTRSSGNLDSTMISENYNQNQNYLIKKLNKKNNNFKFNGNKFYNSNTNNNQGNRVSHQNSNNLDSTMNDDQINFYANSYRNINKKNYQKYQHKQTPQYDQSIKNQNYPRGNNTNLDSSMLDTNTNFHSEKKNYKIKSFKKIKEESSDLEFINSSNESSKEKEIKKTKQNKQKNKKDFISNKKIENNNKNKVKNIVKIDDSSNEEFDDEDKIKKINKKVEVVELNDYTISCPSSDNDYDKDKDKLEENELNETISIVNNKKEKYKPIGNQDLSKDKIDITCD